MRKANGIMRAPLLAGLLGVTLTGCEGLLEVSDPQRYTSDDLDKSLEAVAAGVEGDLYVDFDGLVNYTALNSDEYQHTGTWIGYDNYDHGRFYFSYASGGGGGGASDGVMNSLLRARYASQAAQERFQRVLESKAAASPLMAQVKVVEGWTNLLLGQNYCEAPLEQGGPAVTDVQVLQQAVTDLTDAVQVATAAGKADYANWALAGRARANLLLGNYDAALADARAVPAGFKWDASFTSNSGRQYNSIVVLTTVGENRAAAVREYWWQHYDADSRSLKDPFTGQVDKRLPVYFDGKTAVDGLTQHYSQWKYQNRDADIQMTDAAEMELIEAEVLWRKGDVAGALTVINGLRTAAGLAPHATTTDKDLVLDYLLHERFAEMFLEGQRMSDLHRFGLVARFIDEGRFGKETENPRPTKFPLSYLEAINNPEIDHAISSRCLPKSS